MRCSDEKRKKASEWNQLNNSMKEANRLAVLHRRVKQTVWKLTKEEDRDQAKSFLACSEHQRWKADKILSGWRGGPSRDDERKIHDNICSYSEISEEVKGYDKTQVEKALEL